MLFCAFWGVSFVVGALLSAQSAISMSIDAVHVEVIWGQAEANKFG